jgi:hypothetical protein
MDVFSLRDSVVGDYKKFATSFTTIQADDMRQQVQAIRAEQRYWPEPLIQINPSYKRVTTVEQAAQAGLLHPTCAEIFRTGKSTDAPRGEPLEIYVAMAEAIRTGRPYQTRLDPPPADPRVAHPASSKRVP